MRSAYRRRDIIEGMFPIHQNSLCRPLESDQFTRIRPGAPVRIPCREGPTDLSAVVDQPGSCR
jgi:hypothetical protein